jgi:HD-GYP domain-containing protein (c-di-GMP phosphodiesterase class II)
MGLFMQAFDTPAVETISLAEILSAFSHALDMTEGQPEGHCVRACWVGMHIGKEIGLTDKELWELYYTVLLKDLGCSSNAARICQLYLTDDLSFKRDFKTVDPSLVHVMAFVVSHTGLKAGLAERFKALANIFQNGGEIVRELTETRCQRGADIARKLRFSEAVAEGIASLDEFWDGRGNPCGLEGRRVPLYSRIALLSQVVDVFFTSAGQDAAIAEATKRSGTMFDPQLVGAFQRVARDHAFWDSMRAPDLRAKLYAIEPPDHRIAVDDAFMDDIAAAFGQVVDAKSPYTSGHSTRVGLYADLIGTRMGLSQPRKHWLRRGALLHDVGKLGVSNTILDKPGRLDGEEWIVMQAHATHTHTILSRIPAFAELARVASAHHERLDGKGYPLGLKDHQISLETRIISTADFFDALTADRPYRAAMPLDKALATMGAQVGPGIDGAVFDALKQVLDMGAADEARSRVA